jgi:hypothetical protein
MVIGRPSFIRFAVPVVILPFAVSRPLGQNPTLIWPSPPTAIPGNCGIRVASAVLNPRLDAAAGSFRLSRPFQVSP